MATSLSVRLKRVRNFYRIITHTLKKLRFDWGFTYSFPFLQQWCNYDNAEDMITEYDNALRELYIEPHYKAMQEAFPSLSIPKDIICDIYEFEYGERAYRVFKHYLVQRLKSQHPSTIYILPFTLGGIEVISAALTSVAMVHDMLSQPPYFALTITTFSIYVLTSLCHLVGIGLSYIHGKRLSTKLKIMNEQLLLYIYGGDTKHNNRGGNKLSNGLINISEEYDVDDDDEEEEEDEAEVIWNFKRNYSNHSNYSNTSNTSNTSSQSTFSALHKAFGCSEENNFFAHYTSLFVEDYMSKMRSRVTNGYDIAAFDGLQRWCNVYELEINDAFLANNRHLGILWKLIFFKYILPIIPLLLLIVVALVVEDVDEEAPKAKDVSVSWMLVISQYVMPIIAFMSGAFIFYKWIGFVLWERVIISKRCTNLSQSEQVYKLWTWMIMMSSSMSFAFMSSPWKSCYALALIWMFWSWAFMVLVYAFLQTKFHETFTTMTLQMYLFNYVQHSRQWILQPILFLFFGQIVELLPIFCDHPHDQ